jgi:hypothetical protein
MNNEQLQTFLDSHGTDPARWPQSQRAVAEQSIARDAAARALYREAQQLEAMLAGFGRVGADDESAAARVMTRLNHLPRQARPFWHWPALLLDWQFAPAWPRVVALASCALIGFMVGLTGLDRAVESYQSVQTASVGEDIASLFEPETLTGARP